MNVFIGVDVGTTSIKASAIDGSGTILASAQVPCSMETPKPGYFEIDVGAQWINGFLKALERLGRDIVSRAEAVCVSSVCASFAPVDDMGKPLRNAILYGIDTRAIAQVERLNRDLPEKTLASMTSGGFTSHSVLPKILWLKETEPEIYRKTASFIESSNCITSYLTDRYAWDRPTAAGGHMIDVARGEYPSEFLRAIGIEEQKLPPLRYPLDTLGAVTKKAAEATGLPEGAKVLVGACDVNAEAFACGAFDPGSLLLVYGSTLSTLFTIDSFKHLPGFIIGPSILKGTCRLGGATSSGGRYLDWMRKMLDAEMISEIKSESGPGGILMLPFLDGARIPYQNPDFRVLWYGMNSSTTKEDLWIAAMESMGCELFDLLEHFSTVREVPAFAHVMGGLASNSSFLKRVSNVSGLSLHHYKNVNASFGDALMAVAAVSGLDVVRNILRERNREDSNVEKFEPDPAAFKEYEVMRRKYHALTEALKNLPRS